MSLKLDLHALDCRTISLLSKALFYTYEAPVNESIKCWENACCWKFHIWPSPVKISTISCHLAKRKKAEAGDLSYYYYWPVSPSVCVCKHKSVLLLCFLPLVSQVCSDLERWEQQTVVSGQHVPTFCQPATRVPFDRRKGLCVRVASDTRHPRYCQIITTIIIKVVYVCVYVPDNRGEEHAGTTLLCPDRQQDYRSRGYHSFIFKTHTDEHVHTRSLDGNNGNTHIFD